MFSQPLPTLRGYSLRTFLIIADYLTGRCLETVTDWYKMCHEVCLNIVRQRPKMVGTAI